MTEQDLKDSAPYDVIVVGSGVGGMATALACALMDLRVLVLEKASTLGGTTAWSGGVAWMPANDRMQEHGLTDTPEEAATYLGALTGNRGDPALIDAFCTHAGAALTFFEENSHVAFTPRAISPDYQPDLPGAALGGRALDPVPIREEELGRAVNLLRDPISTFTFGGAMLTAPDLKNLILAGRSPKAALGAAKLCLRLARARITGKPAGPRTLGNALAARLLLSLTERGVDIRTNAAVRDLIRRDGPVTGVELENGEKVFAATVVLASGGFPKSVSDRSTRLPGAEGDWSMAPPENTGDGMALAKTVRAQIGDHNGRNGHFAPVSLYPRSSGGYDPFPHLLLDRAKPGVIAVNQKAERFCNEADSYHDFVLAMLEDGNAVPAYLICDARAMWRYGLGQVGPLGRGKGAAQRAGYLRSARSLGDLAAKLGLPASALEKTVASFNEGARDNVDTQFGKGTTAYNRYMGDMLQQDRPCLAPLDKGPFYAVELWPGDLGTSAGIVTDAQARVIDTDGSPISGLYAAGNDMNSVCAGSYPGSGGTIGPALTFAWLAARHISQQHVTDRRRNH